MNVENAQCFHFAVEFVYCVFQAAFRTRQNKNIVILAKVGIHLLKTWIFTFVGMTAYLLFQATFQKNVVSSKAA